MTIKRAQLIDPQTGLFLVFDEIALHLFEGLKWHATEDEDVNGAWVVFWGYYDIDDAFACSILIANASDDATEPDIDNVKYSEVSKIHADLIEGVTEANLANGVKTLSFKDSKLVIQSGRRFLITDSLIEREGRLFNVTNYRFKVNGRKYVIIIDVDIVARENLYSKLSLVIDTLRFSDRQEDADYINDFKNQ